MKTEIQLYEAALSEFKKEHGDIPFIARFGNGICIIESK